MFPGLKHNSILVESMQILVPHEILNKNRTRVSDMNAPPTKSRPAPSQRRSSAGLTRGRSKQRVGPPPKPPGPRKARAAVRRQQGARKSPPVATSDDEEQANFQTKIGRGRQKQNRGKPNPTMKQLHEMQQRQFKSTVGGMDTKIDGNGYAILFPLCSMLHCSVHSFVETVLQSMAQEKVCQKIPCCPKQGDQS